MADDDHAVARLRLLSASNAVGWVDYGNYVLPCAIGPSGVRALKREGDGATPRAILPVRKVLYRADRVRRPQTPLPIRPFRPGDGWCDGSTDRNYNRPVQLPYAASAEPLWRQDDLYDVILVMGFNDVPRVRGHGSCIFMHIARMGLTPTEGCIALAYVDLMRLVEARVPMRGLDTRLTH